MTREERKVAAVVFGGFAAWIVSALIVVIAAAYTADRVRADPPPCDQPKMSGSFRIVAEDDWNRVLAFDDHGRTCYVARIKSLSGVAISCVEKQP